MRKRSLRVLSAYLVCITACFGFNAAEVELHQAANTGDVKAVRRLVANGVNVNIKDSNGWTPLIVATDFGHVEVVKILIAAGADVNARKHGLWIINPAGHGETALIWAAIRGQVEIAQILLESGASPDIRAQGKTALDWAAEGATHAWLSPEERAKRAQIAEILKKWPKQR